MSDITFRTRTTSKGWCWERKGDDVYVCQVRVDPSNGQTVLTHYPSKLEDVPEDLLHELFPDLIPEKST